MNNGIVSKLCHPRWGRCELVRVEATDWIVRVESSGVLFRVRSESRSQFTVITEQKEPSPLPEIRPVSLPNKFPDARKARRVIESLRIGLPSLDGSTRHLAVGFKATEELISRFLHDIDDDGGGALLLKGQYGQGKTFALMSLEEIARESGFVTAKTEIDATEHRLNKPHHIYRDLMRNLRLPNSNSPGVRTLAAKVDDFIKKECRYFDEPEKRRDWLEERLNCEPLSWLFSDPTIMSKPALIGLLECDPNRRASGVRYQHVVPTRPSTWPTFNAGTQGDFASYLLSGLSRLCRMVGYKGLIVVMDEMEKWHELNWNEQVRAGNLLGGLIWGATAEEGHRGKYDHPECLQHSSRPGTICGADIPPALRSREGRTTKLEVTFDRLLRCRGYPFTTEPRTHLGIAIAMTPREEAVEQTTWYQYGPILIGDVPTLTHNQLAKYCRLVIPIFATAYNISHPLENEIDGIAEEALGIWKKHGDFNTRSGVQSVIAAFDNWRDKFYFFSGHSDGR